LIIAFTCSFKGKVGFGRTGARHMAHGSGKAKKKDARYGNGQSSILSA
jgi:hypothetical protein